MHLTWTVVVVGTLAAAIFGVSKSAVPSVGSFGAALLGWRGVVGFRSRRV